jgi:hypothetical protein
LNVIENRYEYINVVHVYILGLTLRVSVNVFGEIIYMLGKCKCILPITKHVSVHVNIKIMVCKYKCKYV